MAILIFILAWLIVLYVLQVATTISLVVSSEWRWSKKVFKQALFNPFYWAIIIRKYYGARLKKVWDNMPEDDE